MKQEKLTALLTSLWLAIPGCASLETSISSEAQSLLRNIENTRKILNLAEKDSYTFNKVYDPKKGINALRIEIKRQDGKKETIYYIDEDRDGEYERKKTIEIDINLIPAPQPPTPPKPFQELEQDYKPEQKV